MSKKTLHAVVKGKVQGVFFRAAVCKHAEALGLKGTVQNLPDGTVEIYAQGEQESLEKLLEMLKESPGAGAVSHIETEQLDSAESYPDFRVLY